MLYKLLVPTFLNPYFPFSTCLTRNSTLQETRAVGSFA